MFGPRLPYLLKLLAAAEPLSLQAHPSKDQAADGFHRENEAGVPCDAAHRNYRDKSDKPELICALTEFHALCGFRVESETIDLLTVLNVRGLDPLVSILAEPGQLPIRRAFDQIMHLPRAEPAGLIPQVLDACAEMSRSRHRFALEYQTVLDLAARHPLDPGLLLALTMNRVVLRPGEALFLPPGNLHSYLLGVGVEIMANSDNVLRGGLTTKHVDIAELDRVLDFRPALVSPIREPLSVDVERVYPTPTPEFRLSRIDLEGGTVVLHHAGPQVLFVVAGGMIVRESQARELCVAQGGSTWIPAGHPGVSISGTCTLFRATDGVSGEPTARSSGNSQGGSER